MWEPTPTPPDLLAPDAATASRTGARAQRVVGPLETTVTLLDDGSTRVLLVTTHFGGTARANVCELFRETLAFPHGIHQFTTKNLAKAEFVLGVASLGATG